MLSKGYLERTFTINGSYKNTTGKTGVDGLLVFQWDAEIFNVVIANITAGTGGTTELDLKYTTVAGGTWSSIFTTTPKITSVAGNYAYIGVAGTLSGATAPVPIVTPFNVATGGALRLDIISTMTGAPKDAEVIVYYRPR
jgi:hypothetical protein